MLEPLWDGRGCHATVPSAPPRHGGIGGDGGGFVTLLFPPFSVLVLVIGGGGGGSGIILLSALLSLPSGHLLPQQQTKPNHDDRLHSCVLVR